MRVAFIGAHGVGKTTLAEQVARWTALPHITERARTVAEDWGLTPATIPANRLVEYQWAILNAQISAENDWHHLGFLSDRSTIDNQAYMLAHVQNTNGNLALVRNYAEEAMQRLGHYDRLFYLPIRFPLPTDDPARHPDTAFQRQIDALIPQIIDVVSLWYVPGFWTRVHTVHSLSVADRVSEVLRVLEADEKKLYVVS